MNILYHRFGINLSADQKPILWSTALIDTSAKRLLFNEIKVIFAQDFTKC